MVEKTGRHCWLQELTNVKNERDPMCKSEIIECVGGRYEPRFMFDHFSLGMSALFAAEESKRLDFNFTLTHAPKSTHTVWLNDPVGQFDSY